MLPVATLNWVQRSVGDDRDSIGGTVSTHTSSGRLTPTAWVLADDVTVTVSSVAAVSAPVASSVLSGRVTLENFTTFGRFDGQPSAVTATAVQTEAPSWVSVASPLWPTFRTAVPTVSVQATTFTCAPGVPAFRSLTPVGALAARMCLVASVNVGASESGAMIETDGSDDTHVTPVTVWEVGLPAASLSVTVRLNAPAPGQGIATHVEVFTAVTGVQIGVAADPTVTQ